ncbi:MAG: hypothetical protein U1A78_33480 [Polyangia bacterium]
MGGIDFKEIGLAAKDIVFGIGSAAAGASGGPAAAEGVSKAGGGLDRILGMAGVMETRADKFDRADFAARQQPTLPAATAMPSAPGAPPPAAPPAEPAGPMDGDAQIAADHLSRCGWPRSKVLEILRGPEHVSLAALVGRETKGFRAQGSEGTRVAQVDGAAVRAQPARALPSTDGQAVPTVQGARVRDPFGTDRT